MNDADDLPAYYGGAYLDSVRDLLPPERTAAEVAFLRRVTSVEPPARVVDYGCGHGRHSLELARHGYRVTGVDATERSLERARAAVDPGMDVRFINADYRDPPPGEYDLALSAFGSFGFGTDEENEQTLHLWCDRLREGGWLVLELWHRDRIVSAFNPGRVWRAGSSLTVDERHELDQLSGRMRIRYAYAYDDGRRAEHELSVRLYSAPELRRILERAGMSVVALHGSLRGEPYSLEARYLVVIARKA